VHVGETEGWVLTQFLTTERSARDRLAAAERAASDAKARSTDLERQVAELTAKLGDTKTELDHTRDEPRQGEPRLVEHQNRGGQRRRHTAAERELASETDRSRSQVEELTAANGDLSGRSRQNWFIVGAAVLFGGIVIGLIAPTLRRKRRSTGRAGLRAAGFSDSVSACSSTA
jgi:SH3 domain protein